ncbi:FAD-dependent oxidoreductase [Patescibacteria group bacterium]|nr:FAD-dependent oxidoreductase [Patescibacteria group bacterium]MBU1246727.1 FAD-dependent oxidoreductase [Patescibacteria group bacterium]MBU1519210.1 FAD-dependent oxidoreductase [Patescibacteria group bacterium]MBU1730313.1 FAD-dependent oxidoreductase [Patescibacteria group bacterium]MBU1956294.1 FAD-dependent oxidoreductase [Patescibacteria group bacterium]
MNYDLIIIGGGPAGVAASVFAARKRLRTLLILKDFGGQSTVSNDIQNWIGTPHISGALLAKNLEAHVREYADDILDIKIDTFVTQVKKTKEGFCVITDDEQSFNTKTLLIATGSKRRKLEIVGADKFEHKGVTYCASCEGPMFSGKDVIVVGGGNAGFETAAQLLAYTKSVMLIEHEQIFRAERITVKKILANPKMVALNNTQILEIKGDKFVESIVYKDCASGKITEKKTQGVFVEIGQVPATQFIQGIVKLNDYQQIIIDPTNQKTNEDGIWAAGDCTNILYHQNNIAVGDAVRALEDIYVYLKTK